MVALVGFEGQIRPEVDKVVSICTWTYTCPKIGSGLNTTEEVFCNTPFRKLFSMHPFTYISVFINLFPYANQKQLEACVPEFHFPGTGFFPEKYRKFPIPSIWEHPLTGTVSVPPFGTGHFPSRLSPKNETGIPKFEIMYFNSRHSQNSVLLWNLLVGY